MVASFEIYYWDLPNKVRKMSLNTPVCLKPEEELERFREACDIPKFATQDGLEKFYLSRFLCFINGQIIPKDLSRSKKAFQYFKKTDTIDTRNYMMNLIDKHIGKNLIVDFETPIKESLKKDFKTLFLLSKCPGEQELIALYPDAPLRELKKIRSTYKTALSVKYKINPTCFSCII